MKEQKSFRLNCFTPAVSLATFIVEVAFALWTLLRFGKKQLGQVVALIMFLLGFYQLMEFLTCRIEYNPIYMRLGMAAILFLPPLGLSAATLITGRRTAVEKQGYILAFFLALIILFNERVITSPICTGYYLEIHTYRGYGMAYGIFYWLFLLIPMYILFADLVKKGVKNNEAVFWGLVAYLAMLTPLFIVHAVLPFTINGQASIMCGFAIFLATIIVTKVLPACAAGRCISKLR